jgi:CubicO group peptidase (beta-lactamase class C family)
MRPALVLLCGLLLAVAPAQPAIDFRAVDAAMQGAVSALTPGISLTLVLDGRVVYRKSFGSFDPDRPVPTRRR